MDNKSAIEVMRIVNDIIEKAKRRSAMPAEYIIEKVRKVFVEAKIDEKDMPTEEEMIKIAADCIDQKALESYVETYLNVTLGLI